MSWYLCKHAQMGDIWHSDVRFHQRVSLLPRQLEMRMATIRHTAIWTQQWPRELRTLLNAKDLKRDIASRTCSQRFVAWCQRIRHVICYHHYYAHHAFAFPSIQQRLPLCNHPRKHSSSSLEEHFLTTFYSMHQNKTQQIECLPRKMRPRQIFQSG